MNIPTYEINEKIVNLVADITEKLAHLEINIDEKKDLLLRKSSKIKSVNSSCAIEANSLSEVQIIMVKKSSPRKMKLMKFKMPIMHILTFLTMIPIK